MIFNWKREGFDKLVVLFNDEFSSASKDSGNNILAFKLSADEIGKAVDLDSSMRVNLSDKRNPSSGDGQPEISIGIDVLIKVELFWQMPESLPEVIPEHAGKSCAVFLFSKPPVWFLIMVIMHKPFAGSSERGYCGAFMPLKDSLLPDGIEALHRGISSRLSRWYEYQMYPQKKMEPDNLRYAVLIPASTGSGHLVVHLGDIWNSHIPPCFNQMLTQGYTPLITELACKDRMTCHIHSVKGIESCNSFWTSEIPWTHKVCLLKVSHLLCLEIWIGLITVVSFWFSLARPAMSMEYPGYGRDRGYIFSPSSLKLPVYNLRTNTGESRSTGLMGLKLAPDGEYLPDNIIRRLSPYFLWCSTLVPETIKPLLFISSEPFGKPVFAPLNQLKDFIKSYSFIIELYRFVSFLILISILHRLSLLPNLFWKKYRRLNRFSYRSYDNFLVIDVMIITR